MNAGVRSGRKPRIDPARAGVLAREFFVPLAAILCTLLSAGCRTYETPPSRGEYRAVRPTDVRSGGFGYLTMGAVCYADFFGELEGLDPGTGASLTLPLPPWLFVIAALVVVTEGDIDLGNMNLDVEVEGDAEDVFASGIVDEKRYILSEFSLELTLSTTRHKDDQGGFLDYDAVLFGARMAGPRWRVPRYYVSGGYGWYGFGYDSPSRSDAWIGGPYLGLGFEFFPRKRLAVDLDYKMHFYFGEDLAGQLVEGGARQLAVSLAFYW